MRSNPLSWLLCTNLFLRESGTYAVLPKQSMRNANGGSENKRLSIQLNRAVRLKGEWKDVYFLNLHLRCALTVLVELHTFQIREEKDLYKEAMKVDWTSLFTVNKTFAVKGAVNSTIFKHSQFPVLLVKDAIVDTFRDKEN